MNSTKAAGHLLCLIPFPEPKSITERIKKQHPDLNFTYHQYSLKKDWKKDEGIPDGKNLPVRSFREGSLKDIEVWKDVTILYTVIQFPAKLSLAPNLKLVHLFTSGTDHIWNMPIYTESKIPITTCTGVPAPAIAEWVIMNILTASRKYNLLRDWQLNHSWDEAGSAKAIFGRVSSAVGKRIGILGYGGVGRQVANVAKSMGMESIAYTANPRLSLESKFYQGYSVPGIGDPEGKIPSRWYSGTDKKDLHEFLDQGMDYLIVSLPLTKHTRNLLGEKEFEILSKRNTFVINVSRGEVLDQDSLIKYLQLYEDDSSITSGQGCKGLSGAALDVASPESLPKDNPLWDAPNCIISPHISGLSSDWGSHAFQILEVNLQRMLEGKELLNQIDRETGYASKVTGS